MSYGRNPYYDQDAMGLVSVGQLDQPNMSYEFNAFLVVQHKESGRIFYAQDSGCSCPAPFENFAFDGPDATNMQEVQAHNWKAFEDEVNSFCGEEWRSSGRVPQSEKDELLIAVKKALKP